MTRKKIFTGNFKTYGKFISIAQNMWRNLLKISMGSKNFVNYTQVLKYPSTEQKKLVGVCAIFSITSNGIPCVLPVN